MDEPVPTTPIDVEIPAIPDFEEAERSGAMAEVAETMGNEIKLGQEYASRKKPLPPLKGEVLVEERPESSTRLGIGGQVEDQERAGDTGGAGWGKRMVGRLFSRRARHRPGSCEEVANLLSSRGKVPMYGLLIPWHKVAILVCLIFAGGGAYLATLGQRHVEKYLAMLGLSAQTDHPDYLRNLGATRPEFLLTVDADRLVRIYQQWAEGEDWITTGEIDRKAEAYSGELRLSELERVTIARNGTGGTLALISKKTRFRRRALIRDFGRGLLMSERVGEVSVNDGFVGRRTEIKFALLDPRTLVIGDPEMTMQFLSAPKTLPSGELLDQPAHVLANSKRDWLGLYCSRRSLADLRDLLPEPHKPAASRLIDYLSSSEASSSQLLARIGVDVRVDGVFEFTSSAAATQFAGDWGEMAEARLRELMLMLGPNGKALVGAKTDLSHGRVQAESSHARLGLSVANRWAMLDPKTVKGTVLNLIEVFRMNPIQAPRLISPEESEARMTAHQIVHKYDRGVAAGSEALAGLTDIELIVDKLATGVRGGGPYRNVTYRVPQARELFDRVVELLEWDAGGQLVVNTVLEPRVPIVGQRVLANDHEAAEEAP